MGDVFDFWFEYREVIPKGYVRLQAKIASLCDAGIPVHFFPGNHDMWQKDYFQKELGVRFHKDFYAFEANGKRFLLHHGDGIGPGDRGYKFLKGVFTNPFFRWLFRWLHPDIGIGIANFWSRQSSKKTRTQDAIYRGAENEWLVSFCNSYLDQEHKDYFICGHRHLPLDILLKNNTSRYINLGDWLSHYTFAVFDGTDLVLKSFKNGDLHETATDLPSD